MLNLKSKKISASAMDTLIGVNTVVEGGINSEGTLRVDGRVVGDVSVKGDLYIGITGRIEGKVEASNVEVAGSVEGNVQASGILRLFSKARIYGDIAVASFVADEGAVFQGKCNMYEQVKNEKNLHKAVEE